MAIPSTYSRLQKSSKIITATTKWKMVLLLKLSYLYHHIRNDAGSSDKIKRNAFRKFDSVWFANKWSAHIFNCQIWFTKCINKHDAMHFNKSITFDHFNSCKTKTSLKCIGYDMIMMSIMTTFYNDDVVDGIFKYQH